MCSRNAIELRSSSCTVAQVSDAGTKMVGRTVAIRGRMAPRLGASVNLDVCPDGCCEKGCCQLATHRLFLTSPSRSALPVQLLDAHRPEAFNCSGDSSHWCCGLDFNSASEVVAVGTLVLLPADGDGARIALLNPRMCSLA